MRPYYYTDQMELELKNLDIRNTSDNINSNIVIERRNKNIQKDFFSAGEYLIYGCQQYLEMPYYKDKKDRMRKKVVLKVTSNKGNGGKNDLSSRRRKR